MRNLNVSTPGSIIVWMIGALIVTITTWLWSDIVFVGNDAIPIGADAFYHSRRILDTVANPSVFYEFDPRIHAPEGSWLTWPWGFDRLMALLTSIGMTLSNGIDAAHVLMVIPTLWALLNVALIVTLSSELKLSFPVKILAVVCYSLLPFTQETHSVGRVDHHFAEHTLFLLSIIFSMKWYASSDSRLPPVALGIILGAAPAIQNGLFIIQLPLILSFIVLWFYSFTPHIKNVSWFTTSLVISTFIAVLPSSSFWQGEFSFYLLSWLHVYIACCTALSIEFLSRVRFSKPALAVFSISSIILLAILSNQLQHGANFIGGNIEQYSNILETQSVFEQLEKEGVLSVAQLYTLLIFVLPLSLMWLFAESRAALEKYSKEPAESGRLIVFAVYACFGGILLLLQMRFQYLGVIAMIFPLMIIIDEWLAKSTGKNIKKSLIIIFGFAIAYAPIILFMIAPRPVGMDQIYHYTRNIYIRMSQVCKDDPGVVLANWRNGHHIRFHTECSVIVNNFILTPQHEEKVRLSEQLLRESAKTLRDKEPWIKYLLLVREDYPGAGFSEDKIRELNAGLKYELLISDKPYPKGFELVDEVRVKFPVNGRYTPVTIARLFRIQHSSDL